MLTLAKIIIGMVAVLHLYFLALEMFWWTTPRGLRAFRMSIEQARATQTLAANQGLYNGFLAAGLVWSLVHPEAAVARQVAVFFLGCVSIAGFYGAYSVSRRILYIQSVPALLGLALVCLS